MNHLKAFQSEDAISGRIWTDGKLDFKRHGDKLYSRYADDEFTEDTRQVAAEEGEVRWADEPKTLTPQEALRALADGECIEDGEHIYKLCASGIIMYWARVSHDAYAWDSSDSPNFSNMRIAPHPPQPVEPPQPARPPLKVGDRVRGAPSKLYTGTDVGTLKYINDMTARVHWDDDSDLTAEYLLCLEKIEDEPQPDYPLTFAEALRAAKLGAVVANDYMPTYEYWIYRGVEACKDVSDNFSYNCWVLSQGGRDAKWRIVNDKKGEE